VPNVFEFEKEPPGIDDYTADVRQELGLAEDDIFILQPTRIVPRKGIEMANNQILKLTQAVENVNRPQVNIKATNAFVANLQQINTTPQSDVFAKDLENVQSPKNAQTVN
jgi:hypothetical protein